MVTSASRAGSQNPTEIPMRGNGSAQAQIGEAGLFVSGRPLGQIFSPPTERGNRQDQQASVIGFTNLPLQVGPAAWALCANALASIAMSSAPKIGHTARILPAPHAGHVSRRRPAASPCVRRSGGLGPLHTTNR